MNEKSEKIWEIQKKNRRIQRNADVFRAVQRPRIETRVVRFRKKLQKPEKSEKFRGHFFKISLNLSDFSWISLNFREFILKFLNSSEFLWIALNFYEFLTISPNFYEFLWISSNFYEFLWISFFFFYEFLNFKNDLLISFEPSTSAETWVLVWRAAAIRAALGWGYISLSM